jgi:hypothetical protein
LSFGISPLVVGLTVVAFGTSAPEMAVSVRSAWSGQVDIALGNVVGSNIFTRFDIAIRIIHAFRLLVYRTHVCLDSRVLGNKFLQRVRGILVEARKFVHVSRSSLEVLNMVLHVLGGTFLGSSNVDFITLEVHNLLLDESKNPSTSAETSGLKEETDAKEDVDQRVGKEGKGEGRRHKLPCNRSNNGGNKGTAETSVEESLKAIRNTKNVLLAWGDTERSDTCDNEEA